MVSECGLIIPTGWTSVGEIHFAVYLRTDLQWGSEGESWCLYPVRLMPWSSSWTCWTMLLRRCMLLGMLLFYFFSPLEIVVQLLMLKCMVEIVQFQKYLKNDRIDKHLTTNLQWRIFSISLFQFSHQTGGYYVGAIWKQNGLVFKYFFMLNTLILWQRSVWLEEVLILKFCSDSYPCFRMSDTRSNY